MEYRLQMLWNGGGIAEMPRPLETTMTAKYAPPGDKDPATMTHEQEIELDPKIQAAIGKALKAYGADIVAAPIPDRFLALLARLEASEGDAP